jgi:hypothetical protein
LTVLALVLSVLSLAISLTIFTRLMKENKELTAVIVESLSAVPSREIVASRGAGELSLVTEDEPLVAGFTSEAGEFERELELIQAGKAVRYE